MQATRTSVRLRFARFLHPEGDACWPWRGAKNDTGYGVIGRGGRGSGNAKAHRVSYEMFHGVSLTPEQVVMHRCDNPACINPWHLAVGTHADNHADMRLKGRDVGPPHYRGMRNPAAKLDDAKVIEIFSLSRSGISSRQLAKRFGVSRYAIASILKRKTWSHINVTHHHC